MCKLSVISIYRAKNPKNHVFLKSLATHVAAIFKKRFKDQKFRVKNVKPTPQQANSLRGAKKYHLSHLAYFVSFGVKSTTWRSL
jgi:hypothetical protein